AEHFISFAEVVRNARRIGLECRNSGLGNRGLCLGRLVFGLLFGRLGLGSRSSGLGRLGFLRFLFGEVYVILGKQLGKRSEGVSALKVLIGGQAFIQRPKEIGDE